MKFKKLKINKKKSLLSKKRFSQLVAVLVVIFIFLVSYNILIFLNKPIYTKELNVSFVVGDKIGLIVDSTVLDYGILLPDTTSTKLVNLTNQYDFPIRIKIVMTPDLEGYLFANNNFKIQPQETIQHTFKLLLPSGATKGNYSGTIKLHFYRTK